MRNLFSIGKITKVHGIQGEVLVSPFLEDSSPFFQWNHFYLGGEEERRVEVHRIRNENRGILLQLRGIEDRESAKKLIGKTLEVEREDLPDLPEGTFFTFEVLGLKVVTEKGEEIGEIVEILKLPAHDVYLVKKGEKEVLIPAIDSVVMRVDLENRKMVVATMESFDS